MILDLNNIQKIYYFNYNIFKIKSHFFNIIIKYYNFLI